MARTKSDLYRERVRDEQFGPQSWSRAWQGPDEKGFACMPRVLPILLMLAHDPKVTGKVDCRAAYVELLAQNWGQGVIDIQDEQAHAMRSGYSSSRAVRTWEERIKVLQREGFIEVREKSFRRIGYILLRHPNLILKSLRSEAKVGDSTWLAFEEACREFGIDPPNDPLIPF